MSSDSFYHLQSWGKSSFWFIFRNSVLLPLLMLQPALTTAQCYIRQCQISCIEVSDFRFNSYPYCISVIFAFIGLPVCPCSPRTATQPLFHRVAIQRKAFKAVSSVKSPQLHSRENLFENGQVREWSRDQIIFRFASFVMPLWTQGSTHHTLQTELSH